MGSDDLGGYGEEDAEGDDDDGDAAYEDSMAGSPMKGGRVYDSAVKASARRTGDRDSRNPIEKLVSLIEDIFEAEDILPPGSESECFEELKNHDFFSPLSTDPNRPMLLGSVVKKLTKYIGYVARPPKRGNVGGHGISATPGTVLAKAKGRMGDVDTQKLVRLLKILERGVKVGEDLEGFQNTFTGSSGGGHVEVGAGRSPTKRSAKKSAKKGSKEGNGRRSRSRTPKDEDDGEAMVEDRPTENSGMTINARSSTPTEEDIEKAGKMLSLATESILAADCAIAILGSDRLPKQVWLLFYLMLYAITDFFPSSIQKNLLFLA